MLPLSQVVNKMAMLVEAFSSDEAISMLAHLEHRMRTKQGVMKNGPGYLDVAVSSHLDMLKVRNGVALTRFHCYPLLWIDQAVEEPQNRRGNMPML